MTPTSDCPLLPSRPAAGPATRRPLAPPRRRPALTPLHAVGSPGSVVTAAPSHTSPQPLSPPRTSPADEAQSRPTPSPPRRPPPLQRHTSPDTASPLLQLHTPPARLAPLPADDSNRLAVNSRHPRSSRLHRPQASLAGPALQLTEKQSKRGGPRECCPPRRPTRCALPPAATDACPCSRLSRPRPDPLRMSDARIPARLPLLSTPGSVPTHDGASVLRRHRSRRHTPTPPRCAETSEPAATPVCPPSLQPMPIRPAIVKATVKCALRPVNPRLTRSVCSARPAATLRDA